VLTRVSDRVNSPAYNDPENIKPFKSRITEEFSEVANKK
jgi:hypothetical protein